MKLQYQLDIQNDAIGFKLDKTNNDILAMVNKDTKLVEQIVRSNYLRSLNNCNGKYKGEVKRKMDKEKMFIKLFKCCF